MDVKVIPTSEYRHFFSDPYNGEIVFFRTAEERDAAVQRIIDVDIPNDATDADRIIGGEVTVTRCMKSEDGQFKFVPTVVMATVTG